MVLNRRCNAAHDARTPLSSPPASGNAEVPRDKTKPGPCSLSSFIRGRGEQFLRSVWTVRLSRRTFSPAESMGGRTSSQSLAFHRALGGSRPLGSDTLGIHARGSGLPEYFIYSLPGFFLFASLSLIALPFSLSLHLSLLLPLFHVSAPPEHRRSSSAPVLT